MTKEQKYAEQLKDLGIYEEAFKPLIHDLCMLERDLSRARKQLKKKTPAGEVPSCADPLYNVIRQLQANILAYRDALGLTPKSLKKLQGSQPALRRVPDMQETPLSRIQKKHGNVRNSNASA